MKHFSLFFCFALLHGYVTASGITTGPKPKWVTEVKPDLNASLSPNQIEDGYYYILNDVQIDLATNATYHHLTEKIINQSGVENCSQIELKYDKDFERVIIDRIQITRDGRVINKLNLSKLKTIQQAKDLSELQYDELMTGLLILEDIRPGDFIDLSYTYFRKNPLFQKKFSKTLDLQFSVPVHVLYYKIRVPNTRSLALNYLNDAYKATETNEDGMKVFTWNIYDIKPLKLEDHTPAGYDPYKEVQLSEYKTWKEVKEWGKDIYAPVMRLSGKQIKLKAASISATYANDTDRIIASLRFVQDQIRYLGIETGINTHKPHLPETVLEQGYGDCKDKTVLLYCLLREMNIKAYPVLIETSPSDEMMHFLPSPLAFNHVCLAVDYQGEYHFFDPTINYQRGTFSSTYFPNYKYGLVISDSTTDLIKLPFYPENTSTLVENKLELFDTAAPANLMVKTTLTGDDADEFRQEYSENSMEDIEKKYLNFYASIYDNVESTAQLSVERDDSITNTITLVEHYIINNIWSYDADINKWKLDISADNLSTQLNKPKNYNRRMPLRITYPLNYVETYEIQHDGNLGRFWENEEVNDTVIYFKVTAHGDELKGITYITYTLKSKGEALQPQNLKAYHKALDKILSSIGYNITLPGKKESPQAASVSYFMLFILLLTVAATFYVCFSVYKRYDVASSALMFRPIAFGGWLLIPMIGTIIIPIIHFYYIANGDFISHTYNDMLFNQSAGNYNPALGYRTIFTLVSHVVIFGTFLLAGILLIKKRSSFPHVFIAAAAICAVTNLIYLLLANSQQNQATSAASFMQSLLYCAIWIPYMLKSERVKETFTNWHPSRPIPEEFLTDPAS